MWNEIYNFFESQSEAALEALLDKVSHSRQRLEALIFFGLFDPALRNYCLEKYKTLSAPSEELEYIYLSLFKNHTPTTKLGQELEQLKVLLKPNGPFDVDLENNIIYFKNQRPIPSLPLVKLLSLLSSRASVTFAEILVHAYGISSYDSEIHSPKIHNLLFRLRKIVGEFAFYSRREIIFVSELPKDLRFIKPPHFQNLLLNSRNWKTVKTELLTLFDKDPTQLILTLINDHARLSRKSLECLTGLSKASVSRHLKILVEEGQLSYSRKGSTPVYFLKDESTQP